MSVVVPFRGDEQGAAALRRALGRLELRIGDELIVADNSDQSVAGPALADAARILRATAERSSYHARNVGARAAAREWLLFLDADCVPQPDLVEAYFRRPIPECCGLLAGEISGDPSQHGLLPRYARARNYLSQTEGLHGKAGAAAATANLLVRRSAFEQAGGFVEGIRSGGDVDLCWRLREAGWTLEYRPEAGVVHRHRETLSGFLAQIARYAAGARWLDDRHPGASPRWPLVPGLVGSARDIAANAARGRLDEAVYRAIDGVGLVAHNIGYGQSNEAK
ncbi:MAG: glycosyltransferase family 2 protein [Solirubrobacterales bacterium]